MITNAMAKSANNTKGPLTESTEFQLHSSQQAIFNGYKDKIIDFTEHKLMKYAALIKDPQQQSVLMSLIADYKAGRVAVAWKRGTPIYLKVAKENR